MLTIRLFNGLRLEYEGAPQTLPSLGSRFLFAYCTAYPDRLHTRSRLAGLFWPDLDESAARRRLSHALWEVGQTLARVDGADYLLRAEDAIGLNPNRPTTIDVLEFEQAWRAAQRAAQTVKARLALRRAADLYTGEFMAGFYADWVLIEQERLREVHLQVLQRLLDAEKAAGDYEAGLRVALALIAGDPLLESAYQEAMRLYRHLGRPQDALRLYEQCRAVLQAELGVDPDPETMAILAQPEPAPAPSSQEAPVFSGEELPLVGRDPERRALLGHLDETLHGRGGMILLAGEAGVGKSRLLRALAEDADWRAMHVLWGQAQDLAATPPYAPLLSALAHGLTPLRAKQLATLLDSVWLGVAAALLPQFAEWFPDSPNLPDMQPEQERIRTLEGIVRVVLALGEIAPLLLILEDGHWADEATFDALAYLAQRLADSRVLVVVSFRPEDSRLHDAARTGLAALDNLGVRRRIALASLTPDETADLVRYGLGLHAPASLFAARLFTETGGNPLFILESLRTLHAEGLLVRNEAGDWTTPYDQATQDYTELPLSPAVERTIARRLNRLDAAERRILLTAAVLGSQVDLSLLAQVSGQSGRELLMALGGLIRQNLLQETPTAYRFHHDKVRETVYRELTSHEQESLHTAAGRVLALDARAAPASVAYHFAAGKAWGEAARYYWLASQEAIRLHSYRAALTYLNRLDEMTCELDVPVAPLFDQLALQEEVLAVLGEHESRRAALSALETLVQDDAARLLTVHQRYGRYLNDIGERNQALNRLEAGLALAQTQGNHQAIAGILALLGQTHYFQGQLQAALPLLRQAVETAQRTHERSIEADANRTITSILNDLSEHAGATAAAQEAIRLYQELNNPVGEADVLTTLGAVAMELGQLDEADAYFASALPVIQSSGYRYAEARCLVNWGSIDFLRGRLGDALQRFRLGAEIFRQVGSERGMHFTHLNIAATVSTYIGPDDEAESMAQAAYTAFEHLGNTSAMAQAAGILGQFAYLRNDFDAAIAHYDESLRRLADAPDPWVEAQAYQARANLQLARGEWDAALSDLAMGAELCERYNFGDLAPYLWSLKSQAHLGLDQIDLAYEALARARHARAGLDPGAGYAAHLIHYHHFRVLVRDVEDTQENGNALNSLQADPLAALAQAHETLHAILSTLSPQDQVRSRRDIPEHRAIIAAQETYHPLEQTVRLPRADAPLGRPLTPDEEVEVTWTVETPQDRAIRNKSQRRQHQLTRLLQQAHAAGALPAYRHLADALQVSERTILRDIAALKQRGAALPPTRGD